MHCANVTEVCSGSVACYVYHYTLPFSLSWPNSIRETGKPPDSLCEDFEKSRNLYFFPSAILFNFVQPIIPWIRDLVPGFKSTDATGLNNLKTQLA